MVVKSSVSVIKYKKKIREDEYCVYKITVVIIKIIKT